MDLGEALVPQEPRERKDLQDPRVQMAQGDPQDLLVPPVQQEARAIRVLMGPEDLEDLQAKLVHLVRWDLLDRRGS